MNLLEAIDTSDLHKITTILKNPDTTVTESHLLAAITNPEVDKAHCKQLFDAFKTPDNIIPASCIIAALEQSRIDIFLSIIRINNPEAQVESSTARLQRTLSSRRITQGNEAKYEQHKASFLDIIQRTFNPGEVSQLHAVLTTKNHPMLAMIGAENLDALLAITTPDSKEDTLIEHADAMSTGTPPPQPEYTLLRQDTLDSLNSEDLNARSTRSDELNALLEPSDAPEIEEQIERSEVLKNNSDLDAKLKEISNASASASEQEEKATEDAIKQQARESERKALEEAARLQAIENAKAENEKAAKQLVIQEALAYITPHLETLRETLLAGLGDNAYQKIKNPIAAFETIAQELALKTHRTQDDMTAFRERVKTEIIPQGQAALLENESYASFFTRKMMDALHVIFNLLSPICPSTKNSFFQTAPSILAERFEASEQAISASYGS